MPPLDQTIQSSHESPQGPGDPTRKLQVRKGILYRGPDPRPITPKGIEKLRELGVKTVFDIRSKPQIEKAGGATELEGIKRYVLFRLQR